MAAPLIRGVVRGALVCVLLAAFAARAGDWHRRATLACTDCHTMHNSAKGASMQYGGAGLPVPVLLRAETVTLLCLACHSGGPTGSGPDVRAPSDGDPPGGGFPPVLSDPGGQAHALGAGAVMPPDGTTAVVMTCTTCHDPHGNGNYRNLRPNPSGNPARIPANPVAQQAVVANGFNSAAVYTRANVLYVSEMSQWCMTCHDQLNVSGVSSHPHPTDRTIYGAALASYDPAWLAATTNRVPVQNASRKPAPDPADQVFCLSCHKAHGSPHPSTLVWANGDLTSTCAECHNP